MISKGKYKKALALHHQIEIGLFLFALMSFVFGMMIGGMFL